MSELLTHSLNFLNGVFKPIELMYGIICLALAFLFSLGRNLPAHGRGRVRQSIICSVLGIILLNLFVRLPNPFTTTAGTLGVTGCSGAIAARGIRDIWKKRTERKRTIAAVLKVIAAR